MVRRKPALAAKCSAVALRARTPVAPSGSPARRSFALAPWCRRARTYSGSSLRPWFPVQLAPIHEPDESIAAPRLASSGASSG
jgi:hypothetical protein